MRRLLLAIVLAGFASGAAFADDSCESKAVGKDGKALAGAAKTLMIPLKSDKAVNIGKSRLFE